MASNPLRLVQHAALSCRFGTDARLDRRHHTPCAAWISKLTDIDAPVSNGGFVRRADVEIWRSESLFRAQSGLSTRALFAGAAIRLRILTSTHCCVATKKSVDRRERSKFQGPQARVADFAVLRCGCSNDRSKKKGAVPLAPRPCQKMAHSEHSNSFAHYPEIYSIRL